jgi:hypothetical protein
MLGGYKKGRVVQQQVSIQSNIAAFFILDAGAA